MTYLKKKRVALVSVLLAFMLLFSYSVSFNSGNNILITDPTAMAGEEQSLPGGVQGGSIESGSPSDPGNAGNSTGGDSGAQTAGNGQEPDSNGGSPDAGGTGDRGESTIMSLLSSGMQLLKAGGGGGDPKLPDVSGDPSATYIEGNCPCPHVDCFLIKINNPHSGSHTILGGKLKYTVDSSRTMMTWELLGTPAYTIKEVHMKGGNGYNQYIYTNSPTGGTCYTPLNPNNQQRREISHICFLGCEIPQPALALTKTADKTVALVGDTITYTLTVTNTGDRDLENVVINDARAPGGQITIGDLKKGQTSPPKTYTMTVTEGHLPGPIINTAQAVGREDSKTHAGKTVESNQASCTVDLAALVLTKDTNKTVVGVGETITYTLDVTNAGSADLTDVVINDPRAPEGSITIGELQHGKSKAVTYSVGVSTSDLPGPIINTAKAQGQAGNLTVMSNEASCKVGTAALVLEKKASKNSAEAGDVIKYTVTVTNTGSEAITGVVVEDALAPSGQLVIGDLAPGESKIDTYSHKVTASDLPGPLVNTARARGQIGDTTVFSKPDSCTVNLYGFLVLTKTADPCVARVGETIAYTLTVTNSTKDDLHDVVIKDASAPGGQISIGELKKGKSVSRSYTRGVTMGDLPGPIINTAQAEGKKGHGKHTTIVTSNEASCTVNIASITLAKSPSPTSGKIGDTIVYTYTITNNGSITICGLAVSDDKLPGITIPLSATTLAPGASSSGTASYVIQDSDITTESDVKVVRNTATATGTSCCEPPDGDGPVDRVILDGEPPCQGVPVTATASSTVSIIEGGNNGGETPTAGITLDKTADKTTAVNGEIITYSYKIKNTGNYTLTVTLTDSVEGTIALPDNELSPDEEITVTKTHTVAVTDPVTLTNTATATGTYTDGETQKSVTYTDSWTVTINRGGGSEGGGTTGTRSGGGTGLPERIFNSSVPAPTTVPGEQEAITIPQETQVAEPLEVPEEPEAAAPGGELPYTGGAALPYMLGGIVALLAAAVAARRYSA